MRSDFAVSINIQITEATTSTAAAIAHPRSEVLWKLLENTSEDKGMARLEFVIHFLLAKKMEY